MNPIEKALADGVEPLRLKVAAHEVGHGLVWKAGGFPVQHMVVTRGIFSPVGKAYCRHGAPTLTDANVEAFLIGLMGGAAGQQRCSTRYLGIGSWSVGSDVRSGAANDIDEFRYLDKYYRTGLSVSAAQSRAASILNGRAGLLDRLTAELARTGRLSGSAL